MRSVALLALLGLGCAPPPRGELVCHVDPFEVRVEPGAELDCAVIAADVDLVRAAMGAAPERWRLAAGEFASTFAGVSILVHAEPTFARDGRTWVGRFSLLGGVELGSRVDALPHELMHALDVLRGQWLTGWHVGWDWDFDDQLTGQMSGAWMP